MKYQTDENGCLLLSMTQLAQELGAHRHSIAKYIARAGIKPAGNRNDADLYLIKQVYPLLCHLKRNLWFTRAMALFCFNVSIYNVLVYGATSDVEPV